MNARQSNPASDRAELERQVEELRSQNAELKAENTALESQVAGMDGDVRRFAFEDATCTTKPAYRFKVSAVGKYRGKVHHYPEKEILAVDESEANRLYALRTKVNTSGEPAEDGVPLDTPRCTFTTVCLESDKRREASRKARLERLQAKGLVDAKGNPTRIGQLQGVHPVL